MAALILSVVFTLKPDCRENGITAMKTVAEATKKENGCIVYDFAVDFYDDNVIRLYEEWESVEALEAHNQSTHLAEFRTAITECSASSIVLKKYEVIKAL